MAPAKVPDDGLRAYLEAGHSQAAAARHFGVSEPAIHQRLKRMRQLTSQVVALERANDVVEEKLSATARLERVQHVIDEELGWAVQEARREGGDRGALADVILNLPPAAALRQQRGLQLSISCCPKTGSTENSAFPRKGWIRAWRTESRMTSSVW